MGNKQAKGAKPPKNKKGAKGSAADAVPASLNEAEAVQRSKSAEPVSAAVIINSEQQQQINNSTIYLQSSPQKPFDQQSLNRSYTPPPRINPSQTQISISESPAKVFDAPFNAVNQSRHLPYTERANLSRQDLALSQQRQMKSVITQHVEQERSVSPNHLMPAKSEINEMLASIRKKEMASFRARNVVNKQYQDIIQSADFMGDYYHLANLYKMDAQLTHEGAIMLNSRAYEPLMQVRNESITEIHKAKQANNITSNGIINQNQQLFDCSSKLISLIDHVKQYEQLASSRVENGPTTQLLPLSTYTSSNYVSNPMQSELKFQSKVQQQYNNNNNNLSNKNNHPNANLEFQQQQFNAQYPQSNISTGRPFDPLQAHIQTHLNDMKYQHSYISNISAANQPNPITAAENGITLASPIVEQLQLQTGIRQTNSVLSTVQHNNMYDEPQQQEINHQTAAPFNTTSIHINYNNQIQQALATRKIAHMNTQQMYATQHSSRTNNNTARTPSNRSHDKTLNSHRNHSPKPAPKKQKAAIIQLNKKPVNGNTAYKTATTTTTPAAFNTNRTHAASSPFRAKSNSTTAIQYQSITPLPRNNEQNYNNNEFISEQREMGMGNQMQDPQHKWRQPHDCVSKDAAAAALQLEMDQQNRNSRLYQHIESHYSQNNLPYYLNKECRSYSSNSKWVQPKPVITSAKSEQYPGIVVTNKVSEPEQVTPQKPLHQEQHLQSSISDIKRTLALYKTPNDILSKSTIAHQRNPAEVEEEDDQKYYINQQSFHSQNTNQQANKSQNVINPVFEKILMQNNYHRSNGSSISDRSHYNTTNNNNNNNNNNNFKSNNIQNNQLMTQLKQQVQFYDQQASPPPQQINNVNQQNHPILVKGSEFRDERYRGNKVREFNNHLENNNESQNDSYYLQYPQNELLKQSARVPAQPSAR